MAQRSERSGVREADRRGVERLIAAGAQLVDVMGDEEYAESHLPGALHIPLSRLGAEVHRLRTDAPVVTYCYDSL